MIIIYERFENLEETKRLGIINAGFFVFAENGYKKASVDAIIQKANISKGSLFYYFGSKKNFFLYLYAYCGKQMEQLIDHPGDDGKPSYMKYTDFFERLMAIQHIKMQHEADFPHMYCFMKKVVFETDAAVRDEIRKVNQYYSKTRVMDFFQNLDYYKFKEGVDPKMVIQMITWISEGCANQIQMKDKMNPNPDRSTPNFQEVFDLYQSYMELLRKNFYKEEHL